MKELLESWKNTLNDLKANTTSTWEIIRLERCINELEATLSPRLIEECRDGEEYLARTHYAGTGSWTVIKWCSEDKAWSDKASIPWLESEIVALFPLPSMDGGEK